MKPTTLFFAVFLGVIAANLAQAAIASLMVELKK